MHLDDHALSCLFRVRSLVDDVDAVSFQALDLVTHVVGSLNLWGHEPLDHGVGNVGNRVGVDTKDTLNVLGVGEPELMGHLGHKVGVQVVSSNIHALYEKGHAIAYGPKVGAER